MNLLQSREKVKNEAGSLPPEGNPGEQENTGKTMEDSSQVNQETIYDSLAMFRFRAQNQQTRNI